MILGFQPRIFIAMRNADEPPVPRVAPGMIGTCQNLRAAAGPVDQTRAPVTADVGEGADFAVVAANNEDAVAEIFERTPFTWLGHLALVADDLRRGAKEGLLLRFEEFRVEVEPAGQAHPVKGVATRSNAL